MAEATKKQDPIKEIKSLLKTDKLVIGTEKVMKALSAGKLAKVYLSSNCPVEITDKVAHYAALNSTDVTKLDIPNDELGIVCRKMFHISVLGICK
jgi:large subunit ribosomal protein L30e